MKKACWRTLIVSLITFLILIESALAVDNNTSFTINGVTITAKSVTDPGNHQCWAYANALYKKIWGVSFNSTFTGNASTGHNLLRSLSDSQRKLNTTNLQSFISATPTGAVIRFGQCTTSCSQWSNDGLSCGHNGHNMLIVAKSSTGFTTMDRRSDAYGGVQTQVWTWQSFYNYWGASYPYIKYIKWPNAGDYTTLTNPASTFEFRNVVYPKTYKVSNQGWDLSGGTLVSDQQLKSITTTIYRASDMTAISGPRTYNNLSGYSYNIVALDTKDGSNNGVRFSYIDQASEAGNYIWRLEATDASGRTLILDMPFTASTTAATSTSTITSWSIADMVVHPTNVTLNKTSLTLNKGASETLIATVSPSDTTNNGVTWSTSKSTVATVNNGTVTAVGGGTAEITVKTNDGNKTATCTVTVNVPVTGVSLNKSSTTINVGSTETLVATVVPTDATNKKVTWSTSNSSVAAVDTSTGKITGKAPGEATITVTTEDGQKTAPCAVTIWQPVTGVTLNKTSTTINVGSTETLVATVAPSNASNKKVTWTSDNTSVATVDTAGKVTAKAAGIAKIKVITNDGGKTETCSVTVPPVSGTCGDNATWSYNNGTLTISGSGEMYDYEDNQTNMPWNLYITSIKTLKVESGITKIGENAFYAHNLTSITLPGTVKTISRRAFLRNSSLTGIVLPEGLETIGRDAFANCQSLKTVTFPSTLKSIQGMAFQNAGLESVTIPAGVIQISDNPFCCCYQLKNFFLGGTNYYKLVNGVLYTSDGKRLIAYPLAATSTTYAIASGTESIGPYAFYGAQNLTEVIIPEGVTEVNALAFYNNHVIEKIYIPGSVSLIGDRAFSGCDALTLYCSENSTAHTFAQANSIPFVINGGKCGENAYWSYINGVLTISGSGTMNDYASYREVPWAQQHYLSGAQAIVVSEGLTRIGNNAFNGGNSVVSVKLPSTLKSIGELAFSCCGLGDNGLSQIVLPNGLQSIEFGAFSSCKKLTSIMIPSSVTSFDLAFSDCDQLSGIQVAAGNTYFASVDGVLLDKHKTTLIEYPIGKSGNVYTVPQTVKTIGNSAFQHCILEKIILPDGLEKIEGTAISYNESLNSVIIPSSVQFIDASAFMESSNVTISCYAGSEAHMYAKSKSIPYVFLDTAFPDGGFIVPAALTTIEAEAFAGISARMVKLSDDVTSIGSKAFAYCPNLRCIYIPENCSSIAIDAFVGVTDLTIFSQEGSFAEFIAGRRGFEFVPIDK